MLATSSAQAEVEVKISKMHLCCGACVKAVEGAIERPLLGELERRLLRRKVVREHAGGDAEQLAQMMGTVTETRAAAGRADEPFEVHAISIDAYSPGGVERLEAAGVTDCIVGFRDAYQPGPDPQTLDQKLTAMQWYADEVIAKYRG